MKRIQVVLVLLVAVLLIGATGLAPRVYAEGASALRVPVSLHRAGGAEVITSAVPPGGDGSEGDPDSMGDGLSKDLSDPSAITHDAGSLVGSKDSWAMQVSLMYLLAQIQLLVP